MKQNENKIKITTPLLLRFRHSKSTSQKLQSERYIYTEELYEQIKENLQQLLNSRSLCLSWPEHLTELNQSVVNYGITDFMHSRYGSKAMRNELCDRIKQIINYFEPRLKQVKISLIDNNFELERALKLRIDAMIEISPSPVSASFETYFDVSSHNFEFERT